jgi:glutamyl-tRNA synthetase
MIHERLKELGEAPELLDFFFQDISYPDAAALIPKKMDADRTITVLLTVHERLSGLESWDAQALEDTMRPLAKEMELKTGQVFGAIRVAITGRTVAPPLFDTLTGLGRERSLARIEAARQTLQGG